MLSGLAKATDPMLLINVGAGLIAGSKYGSNAGEGLLQGLNSYQQQKTARLNNQLQQQQIQAGGIANQRQQMMLGAAQQALQGDQGAIGASPIAPGPSAPAPSAGGLSGAMGASANQTPFLPGISPMPAGGAPAAATPSTPQGLPSGLVPPSPSQIYGNTYPGSGSPSYMRAMAIFSQDPAAALSKFREDQLKGAQQQYGPTIARLDQLIKSDSPAKYMNGTGFQDFKQAWPQMAGALGMDPEKDYNDQNVREALSHVRNQLASSLQEPTVEGPQQLRTIRLPDGRTAQVESGTGKITPIASEELTSVLGPDGKPMFVPRSQAAGMTPFNPVTYGTAQMQGAPGQLLAAMDARGISFPGGGGKSSPMLAARAAALIAKYPDQNPDQIADMLGNGQLDFNGRKRTIAELSEMSAAANAQMLKLEKDFASLDPIVAKLPNAPAKINSLLTNLKNNWSFGGDKDSAELVGWLKESAGEYAKIISGAFGKAGAGETSIKDAISQFQAAYTQGGYDGLKNVIMQSGQHRRDSYLEGLRSAATPGASLGQPQTAGSGQTPSGGSAPPLQNTKGWTLHQDAKGNKAYVSPDGKQYEEVK